MADLEVLEKESMFKEFFEHAHDIRPSERTSVWRDMVGSMADKFTKSIRNDLKIRDKDFALMEKLMSWPSAKENEFFSYNRKIIGEKYFKQCFEEKAENKLNCETLLTLFWSKDTSDAEFGVKLGEILYSNNQFSQHLWTFFKDSYQHKYSKYLCKKQTPQLVLINNYSKLLTKMSFQDRQKWLTSIANEDCLKSLNEELQKELIEKVSVNNKIVFEILYNAGHLPEFEKDFFLTFYFLSGPEVGDLFNLSWNTIRSLGQNYKRRQRVLMKLKSLDPLPDGLFNLSDPRRKVVSMNHLFTYFPEYMDNYAQTCLIYMRGDKVFAQGNPTVHCKELYKLSAQKEWIRPSFHEEFKKVSIR